MYVERSIKDAFLKAADTYGIVALVGPRQAGKTTFLRERMKGLKASYVSFDDPDARSLFEDDVKRFERQYMEGFEVTVLDEAQYCSSAGIKLKYLADAGRRIWMTSSSETLLGKEILSFLVGRVTIMRLYPFSLREYLAAVGQKESTETILRRRIWEHLTYGGYPKAVITEDADMKKTILKDLYDTMILKDAAQTFSIEDVSALDGFARYLAASSGGIFSYENVSRDLKMPFQTARKYLNALEKSYLILPVAPYHTNKTKEITKQPKIYFIDTGLRNAVTKSFPANVAGRNFENYVLSELIKHGYSPKYWRTKSGAEVDYVIEKDGKTIPVEVKTKAAAGQIEKSLAAYIDTYKPDKAVIVSYEGTKGSADVKGCKIAYTDPLNMIDALD